MTLRSLRPLLLVALLPAAWSQSFRFGLKAGVPITEYFEMGSSTPGAYSAATRRYTVGASGEWRLKPALGFEADVLYHRMGYVGIVNTFNRANGDYSNSAIDVKGNSWDFPVMAKYRFGRPYVAGGGVLRYVGPVRGRGELTTGSLVTRSSTTVPLDTTEPSELRKRFYPGLTAAGGIEIGAGRLRLLPELRYTRWTANIGGPGASLRFAPNQVEFLLGMLF
ncbi:MAG: PorT family protein [Acidobacteriia bacterium]|nr:PorT family protein [Terriglobia bacterium]